MPKGARPGGMFVDDALLSVPYEPTASFNGDSTPPTQLQSAVTGSHNHSSFMLTVAVVAGLLECTPTHLVHPCNSITIVNVKARPVRQVA